MQTKYISGNRVENYWSNSTFHPRLLLQSNYSSFDKLLLIYSGDIKRSPEPKQNFRVSS